MTFAALGLIEPLVRTLDHLGYHQPTSVQQQAIPAVLKGRDLLACAQTGSGKTAGFALPALQGLLQTGPSVANNSIRALILVPTRELAEQIRESLHQYGQGLPLSSYAVYGGVSINPQMMRLRRGVDLLVATPGRLLDLYRQNAVKFSQLQILVLDEADRMLDLGFSRELDELFAALPRRRQTLLFSATFSDAIRQMAQQLLHDPLSIEISPRQVTAQGVHQWLIPVDKKRKPELLLHLIRHHPWQSLLIFAKTRKGVEQLCQMLQAEGFSCDAIHGDRPQPARLRALQQFKAGTVQILVATDVAARGLDIQDLPRVINFDLPTVAEDYVHRIGRTGRAGATGEAISLVCADEVDLLRAIETLTGQILTRQEQPEFTPEHRVPLTGPHQNPPKKASKPKNSTTANAKDKSKIHLGRWFEEPESAPKPRLVRQMPKLGTTTKPAPKKKG